MKGWVVQREGWGEVHMTHHYTKDITGWAQDPSFLPFLPSWLLEQLYLFPLYMLRGLEIVEQTWAEMLNDGDCGQEVSTRATTTGLCHPRCGIHHTLFQGFSSSTSFLHKVFSFWAFCFELQWLVDNEAELLHRKIYIFRVNMNFSTHSKLSGSLLCVIQHKIHSVRW